jgi:hypothetical protein
MKLSKEAVFGVTREPNSVLTTIAAAALYMQARYSGTGASWSGTIHGQVAYFLYRGISDYKAIARKTGFSIETIQGAAMDIRRFVFKNKEA